MAVLVKGAQCLFSMAISGGFDSPPEPPKYEKRGEAPPPQPKTLSCQLMLWKGKKIVIMGLTDAGKKTLCKWLSSDTLSKIDKPDALIYVVDSADRANMEQNDDIFNNLLEEKASKFQDMPVLVFANKQDLINAMTPQEVIVEMGLMKYRDHTWEIKGSSFKIGDGLEEGMEWLASQLK